MQVDKIVETVNNWHVVHVEIQADLSWRPWCLVDAFSQLGVPEGCEIERFRQSRSTSLCWPCNQQNDRSIESACTYISIYIYVWRDKYIYTCVNTTILQTKTFGIPAYRTQTTPNMFMWSIAALAPRTPTSTPLQRNTSAQVLEAWSPKDNG